MRLLPFLLLACCSGDDRAQPAPQAQPQRRVIEPPSGTVQAGPPYVINSDSVGPYKLQQNVAALTDRLLKGGPGGVRFEIPGILHAGLIRAEDDALLIGTEPVITSSSTTMFLAVTSSGVASMEQGIHVGSSRDEAIKLGTGPDDPERARDPRLISPAKNLRLVLDKEKKRVAAIVIAPEPASPPREPVAECPRPAATEPAIGVCMTGTGEIAEYTDDDLVVHPPDSDKATLRMPIPNVVFVAALRNPNDNRDELVAIARTDETTQRTWSLYAFRYDPTKRGSTVPYESALEKQGAAVYSISSSQSRWIGSDLKDIDLYLELVSRGDSIEVAGLLTTLRRDHVKDVLVISPVSVARRHRKPATPEGSDSGSSRP